MFQALVEIDFVGQNQGVRSQLSATFQCISKFNRSSATELALVKFRFISPKLSS